jgi:predicted glycoside hydrolase/deacetylase ChbG (UPF0249 family)
MDRQNHMRDEEAEKFTKLAAAARTGIYDSTMSMTDHFRGLYLKGRMSLRNIEGILSTLPMGLTELMVHPGRVPAGLTEGPFSSFSHGDRETELKVLMDGNFRVMLAKHNILLTPFPEVCH